MRPFILSVLLGTACIGHTQNSASVPKVYDNSGTVQLGEPKVKITPPADWTEKRGAGAGSVMFTNKDGDAVIMVKLDKLPAEFQRGLTEAEHREMISKDAMLKMVPLNAAVVQHAITALDLRLAGMIGFVVKSGEVMDQTMFYALPYEGYMLTVACTVTGLAGNRDAVSQKRLKYMPLMQKSAASLVFPVTHKK